MTTILKYPELTNPIYRSEEGEWYYIAPFYYKKLRSGTVGIYLKRETPGFIKELI